MVQRAVFQLDIEEFWLRELAFPTVIIPGEKAAATLRFSPPRLGGRMLPAPWKGLGEVANCPQRSGDSLSSPKTNHSPRALSRNNLFSRILF